MASRNKNNSSDKPGNGKRGLAGANESTRARVSAMGVAARRKNASDRNRGNSNSRNKNRSRNT